MIFFKKQKVFEQGNNQVYDERKNSEYKVKWSQENGKSMWVSVPEQKSQIKIEQQPCDDSVTVKHLQWRDREKKRGETER